ncbi:hypothetical protein ACLM5H_25920 [Fredinandcohnia humi]
MIRGLLIVAILIELGLFWYVYQENAPVVVADVPQKKIHHEILKQMPTDSVVQAVEASGQVDPLTEIKNKYEMKFHDLEAETKKKAKELLNRAKKDFVEESEDGIAAIQVMSTYFNEFKTLEKETDDSFNQLYQQFEEELELSGYSKEEAVAYKNIYEEKKKALLKKALDMQGSTE